MMADLSDIKFYLSATGGLGGAVDTDQALSQTPSYTTASLSGVTLVDAFGCSIGAQTLSFTASNQSLTFTPLNGGTGTAVDVSSDGTYAIQGSNDGGSLIVTVVAASLPTSNTSVSVTLVEDMNEIFDDWTKDETDAGTIRYRCLYYDNDSSDAKKDAKLWIDTNTPGADTVSIGLDAAGAGGTAVTIADENTAPVGVTFTAPTTKATGLAIGDLTANQSYPFWIKLEVPSGTDTETLKNSFRLAHSVKV